MLRFGFAPQLRTHSLTGRILCNHSLRRRDRPTKLAMERNMKNYWTKFLTVLAVLFILPVTAANAQATRTWVSGVGDDANPCSRTAPCKTFAGAISKTAASGSINVLDPGGFGAVTITKSITIRSDGFEAGILVSGTNGIIINAAATDRIVLDGLDIDGVTTGLNGINILSAREVVVLNTTIRGFNAAASGNGILVNSANKVFVTVIDSFIANNNVGVSVVSSGMNSSARVYNSLITGNAAAGIRVTGASSTAQISGNVIERSVKSLELVTGGVVNSYGDNILSPGDAPTIVPKG